MLRLDQNISLIEYARGEVYKEMVEGVQWITILGLGCRVRQLELVVLCTHTSQYSAADWKVPLQFLI